MTWKAHKVITFSVVLLATKSFFCALLAAWGSIVPDLLEFIIWGNKVPRYVHRTITHWFVPYSVLAVFLGILAYAQNNTIAWSSALLFWIVIGCLAHIFEDALTGKVPFLNPRKRTLGKCFFKTGSETEVLVVALIACIAIVTWSKSQFLFVKKHLFQTFFGYF